MVMFRQRSHPATRYRCAIQLGRPCLLPLLVSCLWCMAGTALAAQEVGPIQLIAQSIDRHIAAPPEVVSALAAGADGADATQRFVFAGSASSPQWSGKIAMPDQLEVPAIAPSDNIITLAASVPAPGSDDISGIFIVHESGRIDFRPTSKEAEARSIASTGQLARPGGVAVRHPLLYIYDHLSQRIWTLDFTRPESRPVMLDLGYHLQEPTHIAVSPQGVIAVTDGDRLHFLQEGHQPTTYDRSRFLEPRGLVFSSWDTTLLLDQARQTLVMIKFARHTDGEIVFLSESQLELAPFGDTNWQGMTVLDGTPYLVSREMIYAFLEADELLLPVLPLHQDHRTITQIALTRETLFLLDGDHLDVFARPQPVNLALEASPAQNQATLISFYHYLADRNLLPTRRIVAQTNGSLENLLLAAGVLIAPSSLTTGPRIQFYDQHKPVLLVSQLPEFNQEISLRGEWESLFCKLNTHICRELQAEINPIRVTRGLEVMVPNIAIRSRLSRRTILLENRPVKWYLERLVFSSDFIQRSQDPHLLRRLNPSLESAFSENVLELSRGAVVVPVEHWDVTAAVPAEDHADRQSSLWDLANRFEGIFIHSREALSASALGSVQEPQEVVESAPAPTSDLTSEQPPAPENSLANGCERLRSKRADWFESIGYPLQQEASGVWPAVREAPLLIGILEYRSTVIDTHQVFTLDPERPTWYTASDLSLAAQPLPASIDVSGEIVEDLETYSREAHHGTHVAALIAGRKGDCWSGLTPSAKLVLIDLTDGSAVRRAVVNAIQVDTRVFNVSQEFEGTQDVLHETVLTSSRTVFVAAAGNSSINLDTAASVPFPARLGEAPNVIVVAASNWDGTILPQIITPQGVRAGSNYGKRYVDLIAPAETIVSASAQRRYGPASGTSQAAPQVAAAAALLVGRWRVAVDDTEYASPHLAPGDAKARLIATARWKPEYEGKVWGGLLDFGAAVMFPEHNRLRTTTAAQLGEVYTFTAANNPKIMVTNAPRYYERSGRGAIFAHDGILFSQILSLQRLPSGRHRVVFKEPGTNHLKILLEAVLEDDTSGRRDRATRIQCSSLSVLDTATGKFQRNDARCAGGISVTQIEEYVLGEPYHIDWEVQP